MSIENPGETTKKLKEVVQLICLFLFHLMSKKQILNEMLGNIQVLPQELKEKKRNKEQT